MNTELLRQIDDAFSDAPYPGDDAIICHECDECFEIRDAFKGLSPAEMKKELIEAHFDSLPLLTDEAKQYFLSAYFREAISDPQSTICQFVIYSLMDDHRWEPARGYSSEQIEAIRAFLAYIKERVDEFGLEDVVQAEKRWKQRL